MQFATDESERMAAVRRYHVLDTPPDGAFDRITALAARLFDVPIAIVSIVDSDRIWSSPTTASTSSRSTVSRDSARPPCCRTGRGW